MMWGSLAFFLAIAYFDVGQAIALHKRDSANVVALDISRNHVPDPVARDLRRRSTMTVLELLDNEETLYFCNVTLGTPAQKVRLTLDTGSSDLWCNSPSSTLCSGRGDNCAASGTYDANSSSTYEYVSSYFNITYADGSSATGDYVTDTLSVGGVTLKSFQFGVGYSSKSTEGVLGIGYPLNEALNQYQKPSYANLPKAMADNGLIKSSAYSLWLNDLDANTGSILFGGVDSEKYIGDLQTLPIEKVNGLYSEFIISLTGVAFKNGSTDKKYSSSDLPAAVLLDSGSSLSYLPNSVVEEIYNDIGVTYDTASAVGYVPCSYMNNDSNFTLTFTSPSISIGMSEMVLEADAGSTYADGTPACVFGIAPAGDSTAVLGDTFLRSAYVVYDLTNNEISLAQTKFNSSSTNILEIGTGSSSVPGATAVANPVTSTIGADATAVLGGATATDTVTAATGSSSSAATIRSSVTGGLEYLPTAMAVASVVLTLWMWA